MQADVGPFLSQVDQTLAGPAPGANFSFVLPSDAERHTYPPVIEGQDERSV
jgi:hypothetical protein